VSVGCSLVGRVCSPCCTIYLLHCLLGISLSICLSVCLLALGGFSLLPPLKHSFLGCSDSHVILARCTRQAAAPVLRALRSSCRPGIHTNRLATLTHDRSHTFPSCAHTEMKLHDGTKFPRAKWFAITSCVSPDRGNANAKGFHHRAVICCR